MINQRDVWWADLPKPKGSGAGYRRPVLVIQGDSFNWSRLSTTVCVPLTSNLDWSASPGCVLLSRDETGLDADSVANCTLVLAVDRSILLEPVGRVSSRSLELVRAALDVVLGR